MGVIRRSGLVASRKTGSKQLGGVNCFATGEMLDLEPAREPRCDDSSVCAGLTDCGQEALFSYKP
jgi:hypothetical protein